MSTSAPSHASAHSTHVDVKAKQRELRGMFFREFIRKPWATASITPSSRVLARRMIQGLDLPNCRAIVEFGPGSGPFTRQLMEQLPKGWHRSEGGQGVFISIEFNPTFAKVIQEAYPHAVVVTDSAEHIERICKAHGVHPGQVDAVISGLGWVSFPDQLTTGILEATFRMLKPGGELRTFGYHIGLLMRGAWHFRSEVARIFGELRVVRGAWRNVPPAFIYKCVKKPVG